MSRSTSVTIGDHFSGFVDEQVPIEEHEAKVKAMQDALIAGEESGEPEEIDFEEFKRENANPVCWTMRIWPLRALLS